MTSGTWCLTEETVAPPPAGAGHRRVLVCPLCQAPLWVEERRGQKAIVPLHHRDVSIDEGLNTLWTRKIRYEACGASNLPLREARRRARERRRQNP